MTAKPSPRAARAAAAYRRAEQQLELARTAFRDTVVAELQAGVTQAELVRATGYTREIIRRIARAAGIPAA